MKNNKLLVTVLLILTIISILGVTALVVMKLLNDENGGKKELSIDQIVEYSVDVPEITTNLVTGDFVRIQFKIQTENKKARVELEKREFQVQNIIIQELSEMNSEQFQGKEGIINLETIIRDRLNELMQEGKVIKVYTIAFVLQ